jgi:hypothetical protein
MGATARYLKRKGSRRGSFATISLLLVGLLLWPVQSVARPANNSFATMSVLLVGLLFRPEQSAARSASNTAFSGRATVVRATGSRGDFVTGRGSITTASGAKGTFGVAGGIKNGALWGHLTYTDHGRNGPKAKGTSVTKYAVVDSLTRRIEGTADINGRGGFTYRVDVSGNREPGRDDMFSLVLSNGYRASGLLEGGNIQFHKAS